MGPGDRGGEAPADVLISVRRVGKEFYPLRGAPITAVRDVSFGVGAREFVSIVGPSGSGKSTLLRLLAGLTPPSAGEISMAGARVVRPTPDVGMVFQKPVLLPWRTVLENVLLPADVLRLDRRAAAGRALELLALVGLRDFTDKYPHELSGGMQQRTAIVRALIHGPKLLLMDEPFGALDAMTREYMNLELLKIWNSTHQTVVFVTHSIPEAVFLSDTVLVLSERPGRLLDVLPINLPRPRTFNVMGQPAFGQLVARIRRQFDQTAPGGAEAPPEG